MADRQFVLVLLEFPIEFLILKNNTLLELKNSIGMYSAIAIASLLILLTTFSNALFEFRLNELIGIMPQWIKDSLTFQINMVEIEGMASLTNPLVGVSTIAGIIYLVIKMKKFKNIEKVDPK